MEQYLGIGSAIVLFLVSVGIFTTPKQLSDTKDKIYSDMETKFKAQEEKFATKEIVNALKEDISDVKKKVNDIYDFLIKQGKQ